MAVLPGCIILRSCPDKLPTGAKIQHMWKATLSAPDDNIRRMWVHRLLTELLQGGTYQLEQRKTTFVIIDPKESHSNRCRMDPKQTITNLSDPLFLERLHKLAKAHNLQLKKYIYVPPKTYVVQGDKVGTQVSGGDCSLTRYRVDVSYWKAISGKYSKSQWKEACTLGQKLKKWEGCFNKRFRSIYQSRMKIICS